MTSRQYERLRTQRTSVSLESEAAFVHRKRFIGEPEGNVYRGWAVGVATLSPQLVGLTVLVMAAQFLAPLISLIWARQQLSRMRAVHIWDLDEADPTVNWQEEVMKKTLGAIFTSLIIMNGDSRLQRMDFQRERLRTLYPEIGTFWMLADAFFNSWCVAACSLAVFPMVWLSGDVNDLILDVFGFLFMQSLDDYSSIIDYGIEQSDFDKIIHERSVEVNDKVRWVLQDGHYVRQGTQGKSDKETRQKAHWLMTRAVQGDVFYTLGRVVNFLALCFGCPAYLSLKWVDHDEPTGSLLSEVMSPQIARTGLLLVGICLFVSFSWYMWHQPRDRRSCLSFFYQVILLRPDPIEVRQMAEDVLGARSLVRRQSTYASIASSAHD